MTSQDHAALSKQAEPTYTYTATDMINQSAQAFRDGQAATVKECLTVQPIAYAVFVANGNVACFSTQRDHPSLVALEADGHFVVSLAPIAQTAPQHPDDEAVDRFAVAMKAKLAASREKGRHGWQNATAPHLSALLYDHLYKADPLDVGNLAMMLHQNGQAIELPQEARGRKQTAPQPEHSGLVEALERASAFINALTVPQTKEQAAIQILGATAVLQQIGAALSAQGAGDASA